VKRPPYPEAKPTDEAAEWWVESRFTCEQTSIPARIAVQAACPLYGHRDSTHPTSHFAPDNQERRILSLNLQTRAAGMCLKTLS